MATLVLSTVGNALGGPVGSAIGALIGQSIDQELFAPVRRGARVGDLAVQTSSYGTQVPRIYGTMRVAGSVVWSSDLVEHQQSGGAKGQPDLAYSYTVSLAVALSSRRAVSVKRIWADGNLLRGATGDFKVGCKFRFYDGGADQIIDPLIGSIEGIANTPAYRGMALAVFEDLELGTFGNRIPFLTFELAADEAPRSLGSVLGDTSNGLIDCDRDEPVAGFAAYGGSVADAVGPLIDAYGVDLFDDGMLLGNPPQGTTSVGEDNLGNSADDRPQPRLERDQAPVLSVPSSLRLTYYDASRDYQTAEARAVAGESVTREAQTQLPAVLAAADAKSLAHQMLARTWAGRDRVTLRLPPSYIGFQPGSRLELPTNPRIWRAESVKLDGFVLIAELRPITQGGYSVPGEAGRGLSGPDFQMSSLSLALIDVPGAAGLSSSAPAIVLAASSTQPGWRTSGVDIAFGGQMIVTQTAPFKSVLGKAVTTLGTGVSELIDTHSSVDVELVDSDQWLTSCDDEALSAGSNLAVLGSELIQFGQALSLGNGRFRLSRLLRGRGGTEWASVGHAAGEVFCLLDPATLQPVALPSWSVGALVTAQSNGSPGVSVTYQGESVRPVSPVNLSAERTSGGDLAISWTRRSRSGFAWVDGIDAPIGETRELYRVLLTSAGASREFVAEEPMLTLTSAELSELGPGTIVIEVQQVGDFAASRPAQLTIIEP